MELKLATPADREYVMSIDTHVDDIGYENRIHAKSGFVIWEAAMKHRGYKMTLISTQVDERSQHLYRRLGYVDCGGLVLHGTPFDQPMELFLRKVL